jgi:hypothetical protein
MTDGLLQRPGVDAAARTIAELLGESRAVETTRRPIFSAELRGRLQAEKYLHWACDISEDHWWTSLA